MILKRLFALLVFAQLFIACDLFLPAKEEGALARVGDKYLFIEDIEGLASQQDEDSSAIINNYINSWINEQLILEKAIQNLPEDKINFRKQLENYRNSLVIYAYENRLLKEKLDTLVSESEIVDYYNSNTDNFELREDIHQLVMVKITATAPNQDSLRDWLYNKDAEYQDKLDDYCRSFAKTCLLDTSTWINTNSLLTYLEKGEDFLSNVKNGENTLEDSLKTIYLNYFDKRSSGQLAPLSFVKNQIKEIIKNQRRLSLLTNVRKQIFEAGGLKGKYEIYY